MGLAVIFLISCIVTARLLDRKKMQAASVAYSVMFFYILIALLFVSDAEAVRYVMVNAFGEQAYFEIRFALSGAIHAGGYGVCMMSAIALTFFVQLAVTVFCTVQAIVYCFSQKRPYVVQVKKAAYRWVSHVYRLLCGHKINLMYCRMLN